MLIDVSHHQNDAGPINWATADPAIDGGYVKITEGAGYVDPKWRLNHDGLVGIGDYVGGYHFASLGDPEAEANHFADIYLAASWNLRPVLDIESAGSTATWLKAFRAQFRKRVGANAFRVYTSYSLLKGALAPAGWIDADTDIWAARYNTTLGWTHPQLVLWQNSSTAAVPGFVGSVDVDQYQNGWTPAADQGADMTPDQIADLFNRLKWLEQSQRTISSQFTGNPNGDPAFSADMKPIPLTPWGWKQLDGNGLVDGIANIPNKVWAQQLKTPGWEDPNRAVAAGVIVGNADAHTNQVLDAIGKLSVGGVDVNALADALTSALGPEVAKAIGEKLVA
jgi:GH25 family lysozyme M1 (1,4-beta-N-acetylmuramidase)